MVIDYIKKFNDNTTAKTLTILRDQLSTASIVQIRINYHIHQKNLHFTI